MQSNLSRRFRFSLASLLLLVTLIALALGSYRAWQIASERAELTSIFGGEDGMAILAKPDKVEAYRLGNPTGPHHSDVLKDYPIKSGQVAVSTGDLTTTQKALSNRSTYELDGDAKACIFSPGVRLDFVRGNNRLCVLICFQCDILLSWYNGRLVGGCDFDPGRAELLRIVKSIFPNDPEIQALRP